jgi:glycosyltransferase involved in cell wall biosynthesis
MKVLHLNASDISGGAARAAYRLHIALNKSCVDSHMLVQKKQTNDSKIIGPKFNLVSKGYNFLRKRLDELPKLIYTNQKKTLCSVNWLPNPGIVKKITQIEPDVINLHWVNGGFLSLNQIKQIGQLNIPMTWTLHDSWAFTGGCHIPFDCKRYEGQCGSCPLLDSNKDNDLSRKVWLEKKNIYEQINFTVVTPSEWLKKCAQKSSLLKNKTITTIPNSIDLKKFKRISKNDARNALNLAIKKKYLLFGAMASTTNYNKGFDLLLESLNNLQTFNVELLVFGNRREVTSDLSIPIRFMGRIRDQIKLNHLYSASDVAVVPSRSENFPLVTLESITCNTPVVAFNIGGIPDMIGHKINGYLAKPYDVRDLATGIQYCLNAKFKEKNLRDKVQDNYSSSAVADKYIYLYRELV